MREKNFLLVCRLVVLCLAVSGCAVRTKVVTKERVDQDISGNRGMLLGPAGPAAEKKFTQRRYLQVEVELPSLTEPKKSGRRTVTDQKDYGNRGLIAPSQTLTDDVQPSVYTVKRGQTLKDIAQEVYGDSNKWLQIYKANRAQLQNPEDIRPGMQLEIPGLVKSYKK